MSKPVYVLLICIAFANAQKATSGVPQQEAQQMSTASMYYHAMQDPEKAIPIWVYLSEYATDPDIKAGASMELARHYFSQKQFAKTLTCCETVYTTLPQCQFADDALFLYALVLWREKRYNECRRKLSDLISVYGGSSNPLHHDRIEAAKSLMDKIP